MNIEDLLSGVAVVIDDKIESGPAGENEDGNGDRIVEIVQWIEREWRLPFYKASAMPPEETWPNLLQTASFVLLDWLLWQTGAAQLERDGVERHGRFLEQAKRCFVPVFIFTNEDPTDVERQLPPSVYQEDSPEKNFVFIRRKTDLFVGDAPDFSEIEDWVRRNASVYALKTWQQAFHAAKSELFSSMYSRSPDWPRVFWKAYAEDGADPSASLMHLINDNLQGRMRADVFEADVLGGPDARVDARVPRADLQALIGECSFVPQSALPEDEIRSGDVFQSSEDRFLLNLRPDCDCVPRDGQNADRVQLYCVEGKKMNDEELVEEYRHGHFEERVWESVVFAACRGKSVRFSFKKLIQRRFGEVKTQRVGRLLHPNLTRIQQRYALYLQRQGLPRIPEEAIPPRPNAAGVR